MLDQATREKVVDALFDTYRSRTPMPLPTKTWPGIEVEDAYRIQQTFIARKVAEGGKVKGYKVGLTSKPMQEFSGTNEPDFSAVTDDFFLPESTPIPMSRFFAPMIEMEIAFVMKEPLKGPGVLPVDVIRATDFVLPAIEIVDFRVQREPGLNVIDNIADLAFCGAVVLGATHMVEFAFGGVGKRLAGIEHRQLENGLVVHAGLGAGRGQAPDDPALRVLLAGDRLAGRQPGARWPGSARGSSAKSRTRARAFANTG